MSYRKQLQRNMSNDQCQTLKIIAKYHILIDSGLNQLELNKKLKWNSGREDSFGWCNTKSMDPDTVAVWTKKLLHPSSLQAQMNTWWNIHLLFRPTVVVIFDKFIPLQFLLNLVLVCSRNVCKTEKRQQLHQWKSQSGYITCS